MNPRELMIERASQLWNVLRSKRAPSPPTDVWLRDDGQLLVGSQLAKLVSRRRQELVGRYTRAVLWCDFLDDVLAVADEIGVRA